MPKTGVPPMSTQVGWNNGITCHWSEVPNWRSACARVCLQNQWPPNLLDLFMLILGETWWNSLNGALLGYVLQVFGSTSEEQQWSSSSHLVRVWCASVRFSSVILSLSFLPCCCILTLLTRALRPRQPHKHYNKHLLSADLEAAFVQLVPSRAHNPPHHASKAPQLFHALCGLGMKHLGHFWP